MLHPETPISSQQVLKFICYVETNLTGLKSSINHHHWHLDSGESSLEHLFLRRLSRYRRQSNRCHRTHGSKSRVEADLVCTYCCVAPIVAFECHITLVSLEQSEKSPLWRSYFRRSAAMNNRDKRITANRFHLHCSSKI